MATEATKIPFVEAAAPSTPAASRVVIYAKSDGLMYSKDDAGVETLMSSGSAGNVSTDALWDAKGDLAVGTGANTAQKLTVGANGTRPEAASGETTGVKWSYPPGYQFDYVEFTSTVSPTATTEGTANVIVTSSSITYDGSTEVMIEFFCPDITPATTYASTILRDDTAAASIGIIGFQTARCSGHFFRKLTPASGARVYSIRGFVDASNSAYNVGAGGAGNRMPGFIRITRA